MSWSMIPLLSHCLPEKSLIFGCQRWENTGDRTVRVEMANRRNQCAAGYCTGHCHARVFAVPHGDRDDDERLGKLISEDSVLIASMIACLLCSRRMFLTRAGLRISGLSVRARPKVVCVSRGTDVAMLLCGPGDGLSFCLCLMMEGDAHAAGRRRLPLTIPLRKAWALWPEAWTSHLSDIAQRP